MSAATDTFVEGRSGTNRGRSPRGAATALVLVSLLGIAARTDLIETSRASAEGGPCPGIQLAGYSVCYPPTDKVDVERLLTVHVLDPSRIVHKITGELLTQPATYQRTDRVNKPYPNVIQIHYSFGPVPGELARTTPTPPSTRGTTPEHPRWTDVGEFAPQMHLRLTDRRIHVVQTFNGNETVWDIQEELSVHHNLYVYIISSGPRAELVRIGKALLARDKLDRRTVAAAKPSAPNIVPTGG